MSWRGRSAGRLAGALTLYMGVVAAACLARGTASSADASLVAGHCTPRAAAASPLEPPRDRNDPDSTCDNHCASLAHGVAASAPDTREAGGESLSSPAIASPRATAAFVGTAREPVRTRTPPASLPLLHSSLRL